MLGSTARATLGRGGGARTLAGEEDSDRTESPTNGIRPLRLCEWDGPAHAPTTSSHSPGHPFVLARRIKPAGRGSTPSPLTGEATTTKPWSLPAPIAVAREILAAQLVAGSESFPSPEPPPPPCDDRR